MKRKILLALVVVLLAVGISGVLNVNKKNKEIEPIVGNGARVEEERNLGDNEFGRYDGSSTQGSVRNMEINDFDMNDDGHPTRESLATLIHKIRTESGFEAAGSILQVVYYEHADYDGTMKYIKNRETYKRDYEIPKNDCISFAKQAIWSGGATTVMLPVGLGHEVTGDGTILGKLIYPFLN